MEEDEQVAGKREKGKGKSRRMSSPGISPLAHCRPSATFSLLKPRRHLRLE